jgi:hypothetical protein
MKTGTLLEKYAGIEEAPLWEKSENQEHGWEIEGLTQRKLDEILDMGFFVEYLRESLEEQRWIRGEAGNTREFPHVNPYRLQEALSHMPSTIFDYMQRAFSLPEDMRMSTPELSPEEIKNLPFSVVIQPEYISDSLMVGLGYMSESESKNESFSEKLARKIDAIPAIKWLFAHALPIKLWKKRSTARIIILQDTGSPNHGKYILFREKSSREKKEISSKKPEKNRMVTIHVFDDIFRLIRSQRYAHSWLRSRKKTLQEIRDEDIEMMILKWKDDTYSEDEKIADITLLIEKLDGYETYEIERALEDRIKKIQLRHSEQDQQRLMGARNDIITAIREKIGKWWEIARQLDFLEDAEIQERKRFFMVFSEIHAIMLELKTIIEKRDSSETKEEFMKRDSRVRSLFGKIWNTVHRYQTSSQDISLSNLGNPYHQILPLVSRSMTDMRDCLQKSGKKIDTSYIDTLTDLLSGIQRIASDIVVREREHYEKLYKSKWRSIPESRMIALQQRQEKIYQNSQYLKIFEEENL